MLPKVSQLLSLIAERDQMRAKYEHVDLADRGSLVMLDIRQPVFERTWHFHPEVELTHIISGSGERFVGASIEPFGPDDLVLLGKNTPHYWNSEGEATTDEPGSESRSKATVFQFEESLVDSFVELAPVQNLLKVKSIGGLKFEMDDQLLQAMNRARKSTGGFRLLALMELLVLLSTRPAQRLSLLDTDSSIDIKANHRISRATEYIHQNLANPNLSLPEVARAGGMSPSAFSRYFHRVTGKTLNRFIAARRIAVASKLLSETQTSITQIALEAGFGSLSSFNRQFKRLQKISPRVFRDKHQGK